MDPDILIYVIAAHIYLLLLPSLLYTENCPI